MVYATLLSYQFILNIVSGLFTNTVEPGRSGCPPSSRYSREIHVVKYFPTLDQVGSKRWELFSEHEKSGRGDILSA